MAPEDIILALVPGLSGILADVYVVFMGLVNILIVLIAGRIIYAAISQEPIIPHGMFHSAEEKEYNGILDQEEDKYRLGLKHDRARDEVDKKHKYDSWT